jgi:hypothetical protein
MNGTKTIAKEIKRSLPRLEGYWEKDIWHRDDYPIQEMVGKSRTNKMVDFSIFKNQIYKEEVKYYFYQQLINERWTFVTFVSCFCYLKEFVFFLEEEHNGLHTIIDIDMEQYQKDFKKHLLKLGKPIGTPKKDKEGNILYVSPSRYLTIFEEIYDYLLDYYEDKEEHEKDRWNVKKLGIPYNMSRRDQYINFSNIKKPYRELIKTYLRNTLLVQRQITYSTAQNILKKMYLFFDFIVEEHPDWTDLKGLSRDDVQKFLYYVRTTEMGGHSYTKMRKPNDRHVLECLANLRRLVDYMQHNEWENAPDTPVHLLIYPEDMPKRKHKIYADHIKHIPDEVWEQVYENLHLIDPEVARVNGVSEVNSISSI